MNFKPLYDRVVIEKLDQENVQGGIIIPDSAKEKPTEGFVVAVGEGSVDKNGSITPLKVKKGDKVLFSKWGGTEIKIDGKELLVVKESDILGIIEK